MPSGNGLLNWTPRATSATGGLLFAGSGSAIGLAPMRKPHVPRSVNAGRWAVTPETPRDKHGARVRVARHVPAVAGVANGRPGLLAYGPQAASSQPGGSQEAISPLLG